MNRTDFFATRFGFAFVARFLADGVGADFAAFGFGRRQQERTQLPVNVTQSGVVLEPGRSISAKRLRIAALAARSSRILMKAQITWTLIAAACGLFSTLAACSAPRSAKACTCLENLRFAKDVTVCDILRISSRVRSQRESTGNRFWLRLIAWLSARVSRGLIVFALFVFFVVKRVAGNR